MKRALLLPLAALAACSSDPTQPRLEILPDMVDSVPYDSFAANPNTRDGKTLLAPAPGTVPRGFTPYHFKPGVPEAERAGRELKNPMPPTPAVLARGEALFLTFCWECHGKTGQADGPIIPKFPMPPILTAAHAKSLPDGRIFHIITHGQGLMPGHGTQIAAPDRWRIVHFLRKLQTPPAPGGTK